MDKNAIGLTRKDYEGSVSTLCAGCGHDSITAALIQALFELSIKPSQLCKMSGIGCSSKTPAYFSSKSHAFNAVHGRMPSVTTGAYYANPEQIFIGISGDGDTTAIGISQFLHAIRRNIPMLYLVENNGCYGLTKGQFSATAEIGSASKKGVKNIMSPIDPAMMAIQLGCGFVARSFSGDKKQLIPLLKAGLKFPGFALIDIISPCVTFNNHDLSTKSYANFRKRVDYVAQQSAIEGDDLASFVDFKGEKYSFDHQGIQPQTGDPLTAMKAILDSQNAGRVLTGLLLLKEAKPLESRPILAKVQPRDILPPEGKLNSINSSHR
jgi:2-oxoglutarate/2-oxoacid ferredoxin oxidoreductase subunit beta